VKVVAHDDEFPDAIWKYKNTERVRVKLQVGAQCSIVLSRPETHTVLQKLRLKLT